jgi:hypothetical protein
MFFQQTAFFKTLSDKAKARSGCCGGSVLSSEIPWQSWQ